MKIKAKNDSAFIQYLLHLGDNALIMSHRNSEWCGHGPALEQDIALTNIALDQIGQARNFYQYAAVLINESSNEKQTEDSLAYLRDAWDFKNCLLVELPNGDWGQTILKQFLISAYQYYLYLELQNIQDEQLAAIAAKSVKELNYHLRWSADWVMRLGDGTSESKKRMTDAIDAVWSYTYELFEIAEYENILSVEMQSKIREAWIEKIKTVFGKATLAIPNSQWKQRGGKLGVHTEHLGYILAEMQFLQRAYPGSEW